MYQNAVGIRMCPFFLIQFAKKTQLDMVISATHTHRHIYIYILGCMSGFTQKRHKYGQLCTFVCISLTRFATQASGNFETKSTPSIKAKQLNA